MYLVKTFPAQVHVADLVRSWDTASRGCNAMSFNRPRCHAEADWTARTQPQVICIWDDDDASRPPLGGSLYGL